MTDRSAEDLVRRLRAELSVDPSPDFARRVRVRLADAPQPRAWIQRLVPATMVTVALLSAVSWWSAGTLEPTPPLSVSGSVKRPSGRPVTRLTLDWLVRSSPGATSSITRLSEREASLVGAAQAAVDAEVAPAPATAGIEIVQPSEAAGWTVQAVTPFQTIEFRTPDVPVVEFPRLEFTWVELPALPVTPGTPLPQLGTKETR